ncbi:MAG: hypothetical protein KDB23_29520, partial [Planctomycetales bacterium]|nr:hypothetical protein [Planctomycetales bacterium]
QWSQVEGWTASARMNGSPGLPDGVADPRPNEFRVTTVSSRQLLLTWTAPEYPAGLVSRYVVYRDDVSIDVTRQTKFNDLTVTPAANYQYRIATRFTDGTEYSTPPLAVHIEPVGGGVKFAPARVLGTVQLDGLNELSGLVASRQIAHAFWTHNDGPQDAIYAIDSEGRWIGGLQFLDAVMFDVEDIAIGPGPVANVDYIYVGDIGGNNDDRTTVQILRIAEPLLIDDHGATLATTSAYDMLTFEYPDTHGYNAESLLVDPQTGDLFILTKESQAAHIYRAPASQLTPGTVVTLELIGEIDFPRASGADISQTGGEILIRNEDLARLYVRNDGQSVFAALSRSYLDAPVVGRPDEPNGEGVTFGGRPGDYFTISEGSNPALHYFQRTSPYLAGDANHDGVFDSSDLVAVFAAGEYEDEAELNSLWAEGDWNGDGEFTSADLVLAFSMGAYEQSSTAAPAYPAMDVDACFAPHGTLF